eukprot:scaffold176102_cov36-Tisochrysis_lutea.AAC.1
MRGTHKPADTPTGQRASDKQREGDDARAARREEAQLHRSGGGGGRGRGPVRYTLAQAALSLTIPKVQVTERENSPTMNRLTPTFR